MTWWYRRKRADRLRSAEVAISLREQAEQVMREAEEKHRESERLAREAAGVEQAVRAEMRRNSWTDTLFGVIQTGRQ